jgi:hypothetical protein
MTSVTKGAVIDTIQKSPAIISNQKERMRAYFSKIYPKEYLDKWLGVVG